MASMAAAVVVSPACSVGATTRRYPRPIRLLCAALAAALAASVLPSCRPGAVRVSFQPRPHASYRYAVTVHADTTTTVEGRPPNHRVSDEHIPPRHTVVSAGRDGVVVDVFLRVPGGSDRTFEVRLDRAGSLTEAQRVERF